ncbi:MFS transporter [Pararhodobacter sp.]|uniref:MFS transporter n=1 Tax=Pararhodobacter sp. TaxID=2127056 RepID=UPI002FDE9EC9
MTTTEAYFPKSAQLQRTSWGAVLALAFGAASLVTSELLPASLLSPMAQGLGVSEGMAGQAISMSAFVAIFASLFASTLTRRLDRRIVVLACTGLVALGALTVGLAPGYGVMLAGRVLFGLGLGAFWAMSVSLVLRLTLPRDVPKALSLIFGAVPVAMMISVPAGSLLGELLGWRGVFLLAAAFGALCLLLQTLTLPPLPAKHGGNIAGIYALRRHKGLALAMAALFCTFAGKFSLFAYIRPLLEQYGGFGIADISSVLLVFGAANFIGTAISSWMIVRNLKMTLAVPPVLVALCAIGFLLGEPTFGLYCGLMAAWGFSVGFIPVAWTTWVTRELGHDAENAGCMQFAIMQSAIATGVLCGGFLIDLGGPQLPFLFGAALLTMAGLLVALCLRAKGDHA